jgi:hypothetical protein
VSPAALYSVLMKRPFPMSAALAVAALCLLGQGPGEAQPTLTSDESSAEISPRYRVEVIVFRNVDFDPTEELLDVNKLDRKPLAPIPPVEKLYFDALSQLSLEWQVDEPIVGNAEAPRPLPPFSDDILAIDSFGRDPMEALNVRILSRDELKLTDVYRRLQRLAAYTPIVHGGWVQDSVSEEDAIPFDLARLGAVADLGTVRLHVSRFLHVTVDLKYRPALSPMLLTDPRASLGGPSSFGIGSDSLAEIDLGPLYTLHAERRILRGELNYIDHPAFGLVILIDREPEPDDGDDATSVRPAA